MSFQDLSFSTYSECATFFLLLPKLNTASLYSGFSGFTASAQRPHPAAVPVRSASSQLSGRCININCRSKPSSWIFVSFSYLPPQNQIRASLRSPEVEPTLLPGGGLPGCYRQIVFPYGLEVLPASFECPYRSSHSPHLKATCGFCLHFLSPVEDNSFFGCCFRLIPCHCETSGQRCGLCSDWSMLKLLT